MRSNSYQLSPKTEKILHELGANLKLARLRRRFSRKTVAQRAGIAESTLNRVEKGNPTVTIGAYIQVMFVLGLEQEFAKIGRDDVLGRKIMDAQLVTKSRAPKRPLNRSKNEQQEN